MKQEISDQLVTKALEYLKSAEAFAKAEVPAYLQEVVTYHIYSNVVAIILNLFLFSIACYLLLVINKDLKRDHVLHTDNLGVPVGILSGIGVPVTFICMCCSFMQGLKAIIAPRMFLIEYFSNLIK